MKILVDHGSSNNLGDTSMIEAVVGRLRHIGPEVELHVINRPSLQTSIWAQPKVFPQAEVRVQPYAADLLSGLPYFWRYTNGWQQYMSGLKLLTSGATGRLGGTHSLWPVQSLKPLWDLCEQFDALHVVGGGNLTDTFCREMLRRGLTLHTFAAQRKPTILTGQQIGPFSSWLSKRALAGALRTASFIGLREPGGSLRYCEEVGLDSGRVEVMGDDSFGLAPAGDSEVLAVLSRYSIERGGFLAANLRLSSYSPEHEAHVGKVGKLIALLAQRWRMPVLVIPIALNTGDSGVTAGKRLADAAEGAQIHVMEGPGLTPATVKGVIGAAFGAVGCSYHFCLFALSQGVPAVCLYDGAYYAQKAEGLCDFWGDPRLGLWLKAVDAGSAAERCSSVLGDGELRRRLARLSGEAAERWRTIFDTRVRACLGVGA